METTAKRDGEAAVMRDKSGRALGAGDLVVYATRDGDQAAMRYGLVVEVRMSANNPEPVPVAVVAGVDEHPWQGGGPRLQRPSVLGTPSRILRVESGQVPADILALLHGRLAEAAGLRSRPRAVVDPQG